VKSEGQALRKHIAASRAVYQSSASHRALFHFSRPARQLDVICKIQHLIQLLNQAQTADFEYCALSINLSGQQISARYAATF